MSSGQRPRRQQLARDPGVVRARNPGWHDRHTAPRGQRRHLRVLWRPDSTSTASPKASTTDFSLPSACTVSSPTTTPPDGVRPRASSIGTGEQSRTPSTTRRTSSVLSRSRRGPEPSPATSPASCIRPTVSRRRDRLLRRPGTRAGDARRARRAQHRSDQGTP